MDLTTAQLSRVGTELGEILSGRKRKAQLEFDLFSSTHGQSTGGTAQLKACDSSGSSARTYAAITCKVATDASVLIITVDPTQGSP
jgi:hypothetical protein